MFNNSAMKVQILSEFLSCLVSLIVIYEFFEKQKNNKKKKNKKRK